MLMKDQRVPRRGLLVDFDYACDLMPSRQQAFGSDSHEEQHDGETGQHDEEATDKQYARGQRTVSLHSLR